MITSQRCKSKRSYRRYDHCRPELDFQLLLNLIIGPAGRGPPAVFGTIVSRDSSVGDRCARYDSECVRSFCRGIRHSIQYIRRVHGVRYNILNTDGLSRRRRRRRRTVALHPPVVGRCTVAINDRFGTPPPPLKSIAFPPRYFYIYFALCRRPLNCTGPRRKNEKQRAIVCCGVYDDGGGGGTYT